MADAFTIANKLKRKTTAIDREREIITTREAARQKAIDTERRRKSEDIDLGIKINQEQRAQGSFQTEQQQTQLAIETLAVELKEQRNQISQRASDDAFMMFEATANPAVLTELFKSNPALRKAEAAGGPEIVSFDKIDPINDKELINRSGLDPAVFAEEEAIKQYIRTTDAAGNKDIVDIGKIKAATGFFKPGRAGAELLKTDLVRRQAMGSAGKKNIPQNLAGLQSLAMTMTGKAESDLTLEDLQQAAAEQGSLGLNKPVKQSASEIKREARNANIESMFNEFGGEQEFFQTDFSKVENKRKIAQELAEYKKAFPASKLDSSERKEFRKMAKLLNLGEDASGELTKASTGIIDSAFADTKKFILEEVGEAKGRAAYEGFRNIMRNALFGAALSRTEASNFNKSLGGLGQKLTPVLVQLSVAMDQVKSDLETMSATTDPIIAHVELGASLERIDSAISAINDRIENLDQMATEGTVTIEDAPAPDRFRTPGINPNAPTPGVGSISDFNFTTGE